MFLNARVKQVSQNRGGNNGANYAHYPPTVKLDSTNGKDHATDIARKNAAKRAPSQKDVFGILDLESGYH